jgi:ATP-dependent RNA helicase SUPV3L1/SUV3
LATTRTRSAALDVPGCRVEGTTGRVLYAVGESQGEGYRVSTRGERRRANRRAASDATVSRLVDRMQVDFREPGQLLRATVHVGPTNSGKTHDAIRDLMTAGQGVYAAPLRQLAREVYESLSDLAPGSVGLVTGEEQIDPQAPIICATAQAAPLSGHTLVLDEAHWVHDRQNGHAWTRLLTCGRFATMSIITSEHARDAVIGLVPDAASIEIVEHRRLAAIAYAGSRPLADVPPSTAVVGFSRRSVLDLAERLRMVGREPAVMYGALPSATRQAQIRKFASSRDPILVTTDVIGHGVNLPIANVVFAEVSKFDGQGRRPLLLWEAAQIAGRAGRFGHTDTGRVYQLPEVAAARPPVLDLRQVVAVASGAHTPPPTTAIPVLVPQLHELGSNYAGQLAQHDTHLAWSRAVELQRGARRVRGGMSGTVLERIERLTVDRDLTRLSVDDAWRLVNTPMRDPLIQSEAVRALTATYPRNVRLLAAQPALAAHLVPRLGRLLAQAAVVKSFDLQVLESTALLARDLAVFAVSFPDAAPFDASEALGVENALAARIDDVLNQGLRPSAR